MLSAVKCSPSYPARVLSLEEKGFGLSILEAEDLAVSTDVELALYNIQSKCQPSDSFHSAFLSVFSLVLLFGRGVISSRFDFDGKRTFPG